MNKGYVALLIIVSLLFASIPSFAAVQPTASGAFLRYRVQSIGELVKQLDQNPKIASRYAKHFGVSPAVIRQFFKDQLVLTKTKVDIRTDVYFVSKTGKTTCKMQKVASNTPVFTTKTGEVVLIWSCGNPVVKKLPRILTKALGSTQEVQTQKSSSMTDEMITPPIEAAFTPPNDDMVLAMADLPVTLPGLVAPTTIAPANFFNAGNIMKLAPLLAIGGSFFIDSKSDTNVPEPGSLLAIGCGILAIGRNFGRRRRAL